MSIEVRGIAPAETDDLIRVVASGFGGHISERDLGIERQVFEPERAVAAVEDGGFVGGSVACTFQLTVPGGTVPCAGITGVAVLPTHRRRGVLRGIMRRTLDDLREREPVSALWATEGSIYGRFGYGTATVATDLELPREHNAFRADVATGGRMRLVDKAEALRAFPKIFDRVRAGAPGFMARNEAWWGYRFEIHDFLDDGFGKEHFFAIHEGRDGPDGYVAYRIKHGWEDGHELKVVELIADGTIAEASVWRFVLDVDLVRKVKAEHRGPQEPLFRMLANPDHLKITPWNGLWVRLVDVAAALQARRYAAKDRLVLEVLDPFCPWNEGRYELDGGPSGASCTGTDAPADLVLTAETLGAAYLGGVGFRELARAGRVEGDPRVLSRADAMFGWDPPPWCPVVF